MRKRIAFFPGSFDPITIGHMDVLAQALNLADKVIIAIGIHPGKKPLFNFEERKKLIELSVTEVKLDIDLIDIRSFDDLVINAAMKAGADIIVRGLRDSTDMNYEMQMAGMNGTMAPQLQTVFLPSSPQTRPVTATLVRQIASMGGNVTPFASDAVAQALTDKFNQE